MVVYYVCTGPHSPYRLPQGWHGHEVYPPGPADVVKPPAHPHAASNVPFMAGNWLEIAEGLVFNNTNCLPDGGCHSTDDCGWWLRACHTRACVL